MRLDQAHEPLVRPEVRLLDPLGRLQELFQRGLLAERQELLAIVEVVVEVADVHAGFGRDVPHPGGVEAVAAEDGRRGAQNVALALRGPRHVVPGSIVLNHRSNHLPPTGPRQEATGPRPVAPSQARPAQRRNAKWLGR